MVPMNFLHTEELKYYLNVGVATYFGPMCFHFMSVSMWLKCLNREAEVTGILKALTGVEVQWGCSPG